MSIFETKFPGSLIDHEELCELVNSLAAKMGEKADVEQLTIVGTDDTEFSNLLDSLAEGLKRKRSQPVEAKVRKTRTPALAGGAREGKSQPKSNPGSKSYTDKDGNTYSKQALNKLLAAGELKDGFVVCSWKGERWVVMDGKMIKEPQA